MLLLGSPAVASVAVLALLLLDASDVTGVLAARLIYCVHGTCEKIEPCIDLSDYHYRIVFYAIGILIIRPAN